MYLHKKYCILVGSLLIFFFIFFSTFLNLLELKKVNIRYLCGMCVFVYVFVCVYNCTYIKIHMYLYQESWPFLMSLS